jgi:hypothetical protein
MKKLLTKIQNVFQNATTSSAKQFFNNLGNGIHY